ncbi:hypothetical protein KIN20_016112 [Parelaphostrongylus tenuis]|uniref:Uncharacterized protein n=1 Tax=Parelaphostrongylus tenuis TaxID=148309 RepID=A0AAD5MFY8_PARTN|nr:hypothetical protein KIN20_016112 [Parelaphostrongylus tenuis]
MNRRRSGSYGNPPGGSGNSLKQLDLIISTKSVETSSGDDDRRDREPTALSTAVQTVRFDRLDRLDRNLSTTNLIKRKKPLKKQKRLLEEPDVPKTTVSVSPIKLKRQKEVRILGFRKK